MSQESVILVDLTDTPIGEMEKLQAHEEGALHRAFSIFLFNSRGELLIHRRAINKYHCGGLWTNTCCSHPRPGESTEDAATRRLLEEMGITAPLEKRFSFVYKADLGNLIEHELDHVFIGTSDEKPQINPSEVESYRYISLKSLYREIEAKPDAFTPWFKICLNDYRSELFTDEVSPI